MAIIYGNIVPVLVTPPPPANPESLIYSLGGVGLTLGGVVGTIFGTGGLNEIPNDTVTPPNIYHGGYNQIVVGAPITYFDSSHTFITNQNINIVSSLREAGLFERNISSSFYISNITVGTTTDIEIASSTIEIGDRILIEGVPNTIPDGIYLVTNKVAGITDILTIWYNSTGNANIPSGSVTKYEYLWDEIFTTPLGLYTLVVSPSAGGAYEFTIFNGGYSNIISVAINDPNIIPQIDDFIVLQKVNLNTINQVVPGSTTDGVNNIINVPSAETYVFKIIGVSVIDNIYDITLDKSITATLGLLDPKWMLVLLNRKDVTYKNLYDKVWEFHEIHREQLLGDSYEYAGIALPSGRMNYLYYSGSEYLGVKNLLSTYLPSGNTPFILLHYNDNIKDRIYATPEEFEVHLPNVLVQGESTPFILTNPVIPSIDLTGPGTFAPLHCKYGSKLIRYGWVFFDLRVVLIDHAEVATAMGYNSNRNYTLPQANLSELANGYKNYTSVNPLSINNVFDSAGIVKVKTEAPHRFADGTGIIIADSYMTVLDWNMGSNISINNTSDHLYYIKNDSSDTTGKTFELYWGYDSMSGVFSNPVNDLGGSPSNVGICYTLKLPQEYFLTYRLISDNYETMPCAFKVPFNFQTNGRIDNLVGTVTVDIDFLSHLICENGNIEGFNATDVEIIIGKYIQDSVDPLKIIGIELVRVVGVSGGIVTKIPLVTPNILPILPTQNNLSGIVVQIGTWTGLIGSHGEYEPLLASPIDFDYELINNFPIYTNNPETLFTGEGVWLLGNILWKEHVEQYRLTFTVTIPAANWNGTENASFEYGNPLMMEKLISEVAFVLENAQHGANSNNTAIPVVIGDEPYIYAKITPVIKKTNSADIILKISVDF